MKKKDWNEGLNHIDEDLVEEYVTKSEEIDKKRRNKSIWVRVIALASCFAIIVGAIFAVPMMRPDELQIDIPTWDEPMYSAEEIARIFNKNDSDMMGVTNMYDKVNFNSWSEQNIDSVPNDEYVGVYKRQTAIWQFANIYSPRIMKALGLESIENYEISEEEENYFCYRFDDREISFNDNYKNDCYNVSISLSKSDTFWEGKVEQIDINLSDYEVKSLLEPIKNKIFDIFNVSYSDAMVTINHSFINVYFYNKSVDYPDQKAGGRFTDTSYIFLKISNHYDIAYFGYVDYEYTAPKNSRIANAKKISLEAAEQLLYKGYVFCFPVCTLCMESQGVISFEGYEYVGFEYVFEGSGKSKYHDELGIPFYTFYKKLYDQVYAKTYVPAIELSGYEEYFEVIAPAHHNG